MKFFQEIQRKSNESQDNRDAYERDYDSSVSGMDDSNKTNFKRQELQHELGHERNNIAININGRTWKVVPCKGTADSKEEWSHLNNMKSWAERKSASTGKKWTVSLTGAPVSETVRSEVQQTVTENEDSPVLGAIIHRIMVGRTDLLAKYGPERIMTAAEDVADFAGDVEEIGSSDVSGWVKQVERMLEENPPEAFGEAGGKRPVAPDPQNYDSDWDYYNDRDEDEEEMKDDVDYENMIDEVDRRGFLKGLGAAAVAGAAGSAMAQSKAKGPGYWANYAVSTAKAKLGGFKIDLGAMSDHFASQPGPGQITIQQGNSAQRAEAKWAQVTIDAHELVTRYCVETDSYNAKQVIDDAIDDGIKAGDLGGTFIKANATLNFWLAFKASINDAHYEWKKAGRPSQAEQPKQQPPQQPPQEIKLNLKPNRQVGDIVTVNGGVANGKKVKVTQILGPNEKGTGNKGLGVVVESVNQGVAEGNDGYDDESTRDEYTNLQSGDYVRDSQDSSGEVFIMRGQPDDRRVRIEDKDGRGWNIAPYRLIAVDADDQAIGHYFNSVAEAKADPLGPDQMAKPVKQMSVPELATVSDEALDNAYHYGRSTPGNTFGWQANLKSAAYAKQMIDKGVTDIEQISDAIHKGWNVTARAFVQNPDQFDDTEKLKAAGKLEAKLQQRAKLMNIEYAQLPDDEQEKDRVVARALLQAIKGQQGVAEASNTIQRYGQLIQQRVKAARAAEAKEKAEKEKAEQEKADKEKNQGVAEGLEDLVQIEYWQQETMESGRWVKTKPIPRATAEKIVNSFDRGDIVDVEQGVAEDEMADFIAGGGKITQVPFKKPRKGERLGGSRHIGGGGDTPHSRHKGISANTQGNKVIGQTKRVAEASLAQMRDYFSQTDSNTVAVDTEYGAPERKQRANVPPEIQTLINKMYRVGKITPQEFEILKRFQAKTGMNVGIKEADMTTGNQGYDSMLAVMKAVDAGQDATFNLGGEPVTLEYPEARFLAGKYKAFLKAGRQEEFLKYMENPMAFDRLMKQLRDLIDKQKNFKGSVPGERGIEEASLSKDQYLAQKKALQDIQLDPETAKDPELRKELMSRTGALRKQAIASGHIAESLPKTNEGYYWCSLNKKSKLIPEGYKKIASGYITRK